jgi:hypothetical protein
VVREWVEDCETMRGGCGFARKLVLKVADGRRGSCCNSTDAKEGIGCVRCEVSEVSEVRLERGTGNPLWLREVRLKAWRWFAFTR